jgi:tRNA threonylcarbamoyladenosine biosynthesis protein TsaB
MRILGLSSATKVISIGLVDDDRVLVETTLAESQAERILFYVKEAGVRPEQLQGIAVTSGPGSYSGLRGGLATAKTLAQTLKIPLVGVSTLEAIAYNFIDCGGTIAVKLEAKADDFNFALFGANQGRLQRLTEDLVLGEAKIDNLLNKVAGKVILAEGIRAHPYGINVARIGLDNIKAGQIADPLKLSPRYSHQPNIKEFH